jgi:dihydrofolate reductase
MGLRPVRWLLAGNACSEEITRRKQQAGKDIMMHGGGRFVHSIAKLGLVDQYRLSIHPMALRSGLSLFPDLSEPMDLKLLSTTIFGAGAIAHVYRPA